MRQHLVNNVLAQFNATQYMHCNYKQNDSFLKINTYECHKQIKQEATTVMSTHLAKYDLSQLNGLKSYLSHGNLE